MIVYGRDGTPMPANGLEGGGAMTKQEVEQVIAYLQSVQISQGDVLDEVEGTIEAALSRMANAEDTINTQLAAKRAELEDIEAAPEKYDAIDGLDDEIRLLLRSDTTCTEASANLARFDGIRYGPRVAADEMWDIFRKTRGEKFGSEVKRRIMLGTYALSAGYFDAFYGQAQKVRTLIRDDFTATFKQVDLVAAPVAPTTAFRIGEHGDNPLSMYLEDIFTLPANLAGIPGISFPVGFDNQDLPVGMQLMAPHFKEKLLFEAAHAYQQVTDWHTRRPPFID